MKKIIQKCCGVAILVASIVMINRLLTYCLVDNAEDQVKYAMEQIYAQENVKSLFLGSSHVMLGYEPNIVEEGLNESVYFAATPVQKVDGSYYLLKEMIKKNKIETVYLDMYYRQYRDVPKERTDVQMEYIYCITDNMPNNWNRIEFLLNASGTERYLDGIFVPRRYGNYLFDLKRFERVVKSKRNDESYEIDTLKKGTSLALVLDRPPHMVGFIDYWDLAPINHNPISDYSLKYLDKIVTLCKKNNIELVLINTPFSYFHLVAMGDYTDYYQYMKNYANRNDILYYDFNLIKNNVLFLEEKCFIDTHHLSEEGAKEYSKAFVDIMKNYDKEEREKFFYQSIGEKMIDMKEQTFGIAYEKTDDEIETYKIWLVANYSVDAEYQIVLIDDENNEVQLIQEFNENNLIVKNYNVKNRYMVTVKEKGSNRILQEEVIEF